MSLRSVQVHDDAKAVQNLVRCPLTWKSAEVTTDGCTSSVKGLTSFLYPLVAFPSLIILILLSSPNFNQFMLNHVTVFTKLLMKCLITLPTEMSGR